MPIKIARIDHIVLTVRDIAATARFYSRLLGMEPVTFGEGRTALRFGRHKINLHEAGKELEPKARHPTPGSGDLCFVVDGPVQDVLGHLAIQGVTPFLGPVQRTGAEGPIDSIYLCDPDGNLVELAVYSETHV